MIENMSLSEQITYSTVMIESLFSNGGSRGTGFITNLCGDKQSGRGVQVLITNKHVVKDEKNNQFCISNKFIFCEKGKDGSPIDTNPITIKLDMPQWIEHPDNRVDLACLPIAYIENAAKQECRDIFFMYIPKNYIATQVQLNELMAMEEVIMIGYPCGISDTYNNKPLIRKGITATHPKKDFWGKAEFVVDIACLSGSSGSPIFIWNEMGYPTNKGITIDKRIMLIGINYATTKYSKAGELKFTNIPTAVYPVIDVPTNLAVAIKAEKILDFEQIIYKMI